jgi:SAM-dependent methyltransferase
VLYDDFDGVRDDLDHYERIVRELGARHVLEVRCGTGSLACRLACAGFDVVGVDPAEASLDVARGKAGAAQIRWIRGDATALPPLLIDLALMTGIVAQVFLTDEDLSATLCASTLRCARVATWSSSLDDPSTGRGRTGSKTRPKPRSTSPASVPCHFAAT